MAGLRKAGVPVIGELLHSYGTHVDVGTQILHRVAERHAGAIVLGADTRHSNLTTAVTAYIAAHAPTHVIVINPNAGALGQSPGAIRDTPHRSSPLTHDSGAP